MGAGSYDLIAIGGGPAGSAGALAAAAFGKTAAIVERESGLGGAGINTGTIPSKTLRESALLLSGIKARRVLGLGVAVRPSATLSDFMHHERQVTADERSDLEARCTLRGVEVVKGTARFLDPNTLAVEAGDGSTTTLRGETILIATGSRPVRPDGFAFEHPRIHDSNEILHIVEIPRRLAVVGAGVIGAEYASTFAALGVEVHLIDGRDTLLGFLDGDVSAAIQRGMAASGVAFHWNERVTRCDAVSDDEVRLTLSSGAVLDVTDALVCAGRASNTEALDLPKAGLTPGPRGLIPVDARFRTSVPNIYAAGDVVGAPALAATGMEQARIAVCHAYAIIDKQASAILPSGVYTIPEASMAGETEQSLKERGVEYVVGRAAYSGNARGRILGDEAGFLKLLFARGDRRLLGVHAVGEQATELVHVGLVAMHGGATADLFSTVCFNYPTLGELYKTAAYHAIVEFARL